jgi:hypothetical protein
MNISLSYKQGGGRVKNYKKILSIILIATILFAVWNVKDIDILQASSDPTVTLYVHGEHSTGGPIFDYKGNVGDGLWSPGYSQSGIMRIYNNYSDKIRISNLALTIKLEKLDGEIYKPVNDESILHSYANNMKLTINKGKYLVLNDTIFDNSFYGMLFMQNNNNFKGYSLPVTSRFAIKKNDFADLEYTVKMDESSGNDMQGLRATVSFMVNVDQYSEDRDNGSGNGDNDDDGQLIEAPIIIMPSAGGTSVDYGKKYPDIKDHWAYESIVGLLAEEIVTGYPDGSIRPDNYITRLEAAVLISRALGLKGSLGAMPYKDKVPAWAKGYVIELYERGIMIGVDHNKFSSNTNVTREEIATILTRMYKLKSEEEAMVEIEDLNGWSIGYVKAVVKNKIMPSLEANKFKPKQMMTRAETMDFIYKAIKQMNLVK